MMLAIPPGAAQQLWYAILKIASGQFFYRTTVKLHRANKEGRKSGIEIWPLFKIIDRMQSFLKLSCCDLKPC